MERRALDGRLERRVRPPRSRPGLVPVAHANDMGGSIRAPASECGLVGLKPTRARTSLGPGFGEFWGPLTHEGVVTRSVRDTAAVLDAIAGPMPGDPYTAPAPARPYASEVGADPGALSIGVRTAAICRDARGRPGGASPRSKRSVACSTQLGHRVEERGPTALDDDVNRGFFPVFASAVARDLDRWSARTGDPIGPADVEPLNWTTAEFGRARQRTGLPRGRRAAPGRLAPTRRVVEVPRPARHADDRRPPSVARCDVARRRRSRRRCR